MKKSTKKQILSVILLIAFVASSLTFAFLNTAPTQDQEDVWMARVSVVIEGELQIIPAGTGINGDSKDKIYTLEADNLIYKNTDEPVMLKDLFDVWEETFNSTCIMDYCNIENKSIQMFVNNVVNADYELYRIKNRDDIIIDYR